MSFNPCKTALITGGSCEIGYHLTQCFAKDQYGVILVRATRSDFERVAKEFKEEFRCPQVIWIDKDLSKPNSARELF